MLKGTAHSDTSLSRTSNHSNPTLHVPTEPLCSARISRKDVQSQFYLEILLNGYKKIFYSALILLCSFL